MYAALHDSAQNHSGCLYVFQLYKTDPSLIEVRINFLFSPDLSSGVDGDVYQVRNCQLLYSVDV